LEKTVGLTLLETNRNNTKQVFSSLNQNINSKSEAQITGGGVVGKYSTNFTGWVLC